MKIQSGPVMNYFHRVYPEDEEKPLEGCRPTMYLLDTWSSSAFKNSWARLST